VVEFVVVCTGAAGPVTDAVQAHGGRCGSLWKEGRHGDRSRMFFRSSAAA
ncbi:hypothetical protein CDAR_228911, partial [Caerostris darwini]